MSEHEQHPDENPEAGYPAEGGDTLPEEGDPQGEASQHRAGEWESKAGKGGDETHGAGEHDDPNG